MTKTLQRLLLCNVTEKKCKICRCRPEHAFDIHLPLGFLVYRVSSNFKSIWVSQSSFPTGFAPWWPCYSLDLFQSGQNLSHQHILVVVYGLIVKSCPTLCDPMDYSLPGSSVHGILQARILDWVSSSFVSHQKLSILQWHKQICPLSWHQETANASAGAALWLCVSFPTDTPSSLNVIWRALMKSNDIVSCNLLWNKRTQ